MGQFCKANNTGNWVFLSMGVVGLQGLYPELVHPVRCIVALSGSWWVLEYIMQITPN